MNKEELINFLKEGNGIIVNNALEGNIVIDFMKENGLIEENDSIMRPGFPRSRVLYAVNNRWTTKMSETFEEGVIPYDKIKNMISNNHTIKKVKRTNKYFIYYELIYGTSEVVYKDSFIFETDDLTNEKLHKKAIEIENRFRGYSDERFRFSNVVFVNIVKL